MPDSVRGASAYSLWGCIGTATAGGPLLAKSAPASLSGETSQAAGGLPVGEAPPNAEILSTPVERQVVHPVAVAGHPVEAVERLDVARLLPVLVTLLGCVVSPVVVEHQVVEGH